MNYDTQLDQQVSALMKKLYPKNVIAFTGETLSSRQRLYAHLIVACSANERGRK